MTTPLRFEEAGALFLRVELGVVVASAEALMGFASEPLVCLQKGRCNKKEKVCSMTRHMHLIGWGFTEISTVGV